MEKHEIKKDEAVKENCYTMPDSVSGSSAYTYMAELFAVPSVLKRIYARTGVEVFTSVQEMYRRRSLLPKSLRGRIRLRLRFVNAKCFMPFKEKSMW